MTSDEHASGWHTRRCSPAMPDWNLRDVTGAGGPAGYLNPPYVGRHPTSAPGDRPRWPDRGRIKGADSAALNTPPPSDHA